MSFCGITLKKICDEQNKLLKNAKISKINMESATSFVIELYKPNIKNVNLKIELSPNKYSMYLLYKNVNSKYKTNFLECLRKVLINKKISAIYTNSIERIAFIDIIGFNEFNEYEELRLVIEFFGKHNNLILLNSQNVIIDSFKHLLKDDNPKSRNIFPKYVYCLPQSDKKSIFDLSCSSFVNLFDGCSFLDLPHSISNEITGISKDFVLGFIENFDILPDDFLSSFYLYILNCLDNLNNLELKISSNSYYPFLPSKNINKKDKLESLQNPNELKYNFKEELNFNNNLSKYLEQKYLKQDFNLKKQEYLKRINTKIKKYEKQKQNIEKKLTDSSNKDIFNHYGMLLTTYLYSFNPNEKKDSIEVFDFINNSNITINLNKKYSILDNSKIFFKKYKKLKNQEEIVIDQLAKTNEYLLYLNSILFSIENANSQEELEDIKDELNEIDKSNENKTKTKTNKQKQINKEKSFNPIELKILGHKVFIGKNNSENEYLTLKFAKHYDLWFHVKDFARSHVILKLDANEQISNDLIIEVAKLAALHSKAKLSSNIAVDYTFVKHIKKPKGTPLGFVTFTNNKTVFVNI